MAALTMKTDPATEFQLALGLVIVFVVTTVTVVFGCWCGKKRRKQSQFGLPEKGIPDDIDFHNGKQQPSPKVSVFGERKYSEANDYSEQKRKAVESLHNKRLNADNQVPPPSTTAQSLAPLAEDGYSMLGPDGDIILSDKPEENVLPVDEGPEYDEVNEEDPPGDEQLQDVSTEYVIDDDKAYYSVAYWEPANKEEELMDQLYSTLKLQRIPAESVELKEQLGSGQFGTVYRGLWRKESEDGGEVDGDEEVMEVAVKSLVKEASEHEKVTFLREAAIMGQFNHPYLVKILAIIDDEPVKLVEELMPKGDLRQHLSSLRPKEGEVQCRELAGLLLSHSRQIALGMLCLQMKQFIHRDLAARNVLVTQDGLCKIADFGLSRNLQNEDHYTSRGGKIPVKWTAPEALHYRKYSTASDVWSYGCLLYEIWSLGYKPFHDCTNAQTIKKIDSGYRLPPPPGCPRYIYQIMINCWNPEALSRPSFCAIIIALQHPDHEILKWLEKDKAVSSKKAMTLGAPIEEGASLFKDLQRTYMQKPVV